MTEVLDLRKRGRKKSIEAPARSEDFSFPAEESLSFDQEPAPRRGRGGLRWLIVTVVAVALTTVGIKASDTLFSSKTAENSICPQGMAFVPTSQGGFCIDKYEASAGDKCPRQNPQNQDETRANLEDALCQPASAAGAAPWRNISQNQASVACAKAGKRLPTSAEWLAASLATPDKGSGWTADDCQVNNNWEAQPGAAGSGKNCVSGIGAFDMIGNVWEWVDGTVVDGKYKEAELPSDGYIKGVDSLAMPTETNPDSPDPNYQNDYFWIKKTGTRGIARGGYWANGAEAGVYSAYIVTPPSFVGTGVGFRCVK